MSGLPQQWQITMVAAMGLFYYMYQMKPQLNKTTTLQPIPQRSINTSTHNPLYQIQVDAPINTDLRDDTLGGSSLEGAYSYVQNKYKVEARENPGVNLVVNSIT